MKRIAHIYYVHQDLDKAHQFLLDFGFTAVEKRPDRIFHKGYDTKPFEYRAIKSDKPAFGGTIVTSATPSTGPRPTRRTGRRLRRPPPPRPRGPTPRFRAAASGAASGRRVAAPGPRIFDYRWDPSRFVLERYSEWALFRSSVGRRGTDRWARLMAIWSTIRRRRAAPRLALISFMSGELGLRAISEAGSSTYADAWGSADSRRLSCSDDVRKGICTVFGDGHV